MMKSAFSSSVREKREEQGQTRFAGGGKQLMVVTDGEQKSNRGGVMKVMTEQLILFLTGYLSY